METIVAINTGRVVIGGLAAGVVLNIIDFVSNAFIFAERMTAEANAFKPGLGDMQAAASGSTIAKYVVMDFILGLILAWSYAAMRPRFGAGAKTAIYVAIVFWIFGGIMSFSFLQMGMMSTGLWIQYALVWLVNLVLASLAAGMLYKEDAAA
jgi:hypothetical protein